jgi:IS30 family transposase
MALLERDEISRGLVEDPMMTWTELARRVGRHPGTVAREVARHGGRHRYRAAVADARAVRSRRRRRPGRLVVDRELREQVTDGLRAGFSPAGIAARLRNDGGVTVCAETIYTAVYAGRLDVRARQCLRWRRPRRRHRQTRVEAANSHVWAISRRSPSGPSR